MREYKFFTVWGVKTVKGAHIMEALRNFFTWCYDNDISDEIIAIIEPERCASIMNVSKIEKQHLTN